MAVRDIGSGGHVTCAHTPMFHFHSDALRCGACCRACRTCLSGDAEAAYRFGTILRLDPNKRGESCQWVDRAAWSGHPDAQFAKATALLSGSDGEEHDEADISPVFVCSLVLLLGSALHLAVRIWQLKICEFRMRFAVSCVDANSNLWCCI